MDSLAGGMPIPDPRFSTSATPSMPEMMEVQLAKQIVNHLDEQPKSIPKATSPGFKAALNPL
jgi:hypothetical protein